MDNRLELNLFIEPGREGTYFTLPFTMPPDVESMSLRYRYDRHLESQIDVECGTFIARREANIIDLGLVSPGGVQVGASGSDKLEIYIGESEATPGYRPVPLTPGRWEIIVGAYKIDPAGVNVTYEVIFTFKKLRLLKGDLHTHTVASDGLFTPAELARRARVNGLDFLAITDHNQMSTGESLPRMKGLTLIPGIEWTHYRGHANFLGVDRPYDEPFHEYSRRGAGAFSICPGARRPDHDQPSLRGGVRVSVRSE
ncbi:MAG: PHP domain-containing protein [Dethiobacteria bacterium]